MRIFFNFNSKEHILKKLLENKSYESGHCAPSEEVSLVYTKELTKNKLAIIVCNKRNGLFNDRKNLDDHFSNELCNLKIKNEPTRLDPLSLLNLNPHQHVHSSQNKTIFPCYVNKQLVKAK